VIYRSAESGFLSNRMIAAACIAALHAVVAYVLIVALTPRFTAEPPTRMITRFFNDPVTPERPLPPKYTLDRLAPRVTAPPQPLIIDAPPATTEQAPPSPSGADLDLAPPGVATPDAPRVVGRNQLPNSADFYPADLRRQGIQGATAVQVCVDANGNRAGEPQVEESSGNLRLDEGAVNVARHGRYARTMQGNTGVPNCYRFRIVFRIK
jgi:TonB family protein